MNQEQQFRQLVDQWYRDTMFDSSPHQMQRYRSFLDIVEMGEPAVPLILRELQRNTSWLILALHQLAADPPEIPVSMQGRLHSIIQLWLDWGRQHGYLEDPA